MYLERLLQINMATLAALGALLLGMGQRSEGPPLLVALAAAVSVWLTDITGRFCLGRRVANVLMLLAAVVSLGQCVSAEERIAGPRLRLVLDLSANHLPLPGEG